MDNMFAHSMAAPPSMMPAGVLGGGFAPPIPACPICGRHFPTWITMRSHMSICVKAEPDVPMFAPQASVSSVGAPAALEYEDICMQAMQQIQHPSPPKAHQNHPNSPVRKPVNDRSIARSPYGSHNDIPRSSSHPYKVTSKGPAPNSRPISQPKPQPPLAADPPVARQAPRAESQSQLGANVKYYECYMCGMKYLSPWGLEKHIMNHISGMISVQNTHPAHSQSSSGLPPPPPLNADVVPLGGSIRWDIKVKAEPGIEPPPPPTPTPARDISNAQSTHGHQNSATDVRIKLEPDDPLHQAVAEAQYGGNFVTTVSAATGVPPPPQARATATRPPQATATKQCQEAMTPQPQCSLCTVSFGTLSELTQHMSIHTRDMPCMCPVCGKWFQAPSYLTRHINKSHSDSTPASKPTKLKPISSSGTTNAQSTPRATTTKTEEASTAGGERSLNLTTSITNSAGSQLNVKTSPNTDMPSTSTFSASSGHATSDNNNSNIINNNNNNHNNRPSTSQPAVYIDYAEQDSSMVDVKTEDGLHICILCGKEFDSWDEVNHHLQEHNSMAQGYMNFHVPPQQNNINHQVPPQQNNFNHQVPPQQNNLNHQVPPQQNNTNYNTVLQHSNQQNSQLQQIPANHNNIFDPSVTTPNDPAKRKSRPSRNTQISNSWDTMSLLKKSIADAEATKASRPPSSVLHKDYGCPVCGRYFLLRTDLERHYVLHTGERPWKCLICQVRFNNPSTLYKHITSHTMAFPNTCLICNTVFPGTEELITHILTHVKNEKTPTCPYCGKQRVTVSGFRNHMYSHIQVQRYECQYCSQGFIRKPEYIKHVRRHTGEKLVLCCVCNQEFSTPQALTRHRRKVFNKCFTAGNIFEPAPAGSGDGAADENHLNQGADDVMQAGPVSVAATKRKDKQSRECKQCGEKLPNLTAFREHVKQHRTQIQQQRMQDQQQQQIPGQLNPDQVDPTKKYRLSGKRGFRKCLYCEKKFRRSSKLSKHIASHRCTCCNVVFTRISELHKHQARVQSQRRFTCCLCKEKFSHMSVLTRHLKVHDMQRCKVCKLEFVSELALHRHICPVTVDSCDFSSCDRCVAGFEFPFTVTRHVRRHVRQVRVCRLEVEGLI